MNVYIIMEHNWDGKEEAVKHYRSTRSLWADNRISYEDEDLYFLIKRRFECRIFEERIRDNINRW